MDRSVYNNVKRRHRNELIDYKVMFKTDLDRAKKLYRLADKKSNEAYALLTRVFELEGILADLERDLKRCV